MIQSTSFVPRFTILWSFLSITLERPEETAMMQQLRTHQKHVMYYERPDILQKARSVVPIQDLEKKANEKLAPNGDIKEEVSLN